MGFFVTATGYLVRFFFELAIFIILLILVLTIFFPPPPPPVTGADSAGKPAPGAAYGNLVYFLQASDIHLSKYRSERNEQFAVFCNETVPVVNPALVLVTGDITDALKNAPGTSSYYQNEQLIEEWDFYRDTLQAHGYWNKSFWLDVRGNHDAYAIADYNGPTNYYLTHGVHGDSRDYIFVLETGFGSYQFVSLDMSYDLGLSAPFDFFGLVPKDISSVEAAVNNADQYSHTILFGHYPRVTSMNRVPWETLTEGKVLAYLCGHLHTDEMYAVMPESYLELELEDMKSHKKYRLLAFDHDLFSFHDSYLSTWPLVHVTNPKDARFLSNLEPLDLIAESTHVRVLVFSPLPITSVTMRLDDGDEIAMTLAEPGKSLYVAPWDPSELSPGIHTLVVEATDTAGTQRTTTQFSVDKTRLDIARTQGTIIQHAPAHAFFQWTFSFVYIYSLGVMLLFSKIQARLRNRDEGEVPEYSSLFKKPTEDTVVAVVKKEAWTKILFYGSLSTLNYIFLLFFWFNLVIGPILIGPIVDVEHYGAVFVWGAASNVTYTFTVEGIMAAWLLLIFIYLPAFHVLALIDVAIFRKTPLLNASIVFYTLAFLIVSALCLYLVTYFGTVTCFFLSPGLTWFTFLALGLMIKGVIFHRRALASKEAPTL